MEKFQSSDGKHHNMHTKISLGLVIELSHWVDGKVAKALELQPRRRLITFPLNEARRVP